MKALYDLLIECHRPSSTDKTPTVSCVEGRTLAAWPGRCWEPVSFRTPDTNWELPAAAGRRVPRGCGAERSPSGGGRGQSRSTLPF